jgi:hypothetical protein
MNKFCLNQPKRSTENVPETPSRRCLGYDRDTAGRLYAESMLLSYTRIATGLHWGCNLIASGCAGYNISA